MDAEEAAALARAADTAPAVAVAQPTMSAQDASAAESEQVAVAAARHAAVLEAALASIIGSTLVAAMDALQGPTDADADAR